MQSRIVGPFGPLPDGADRAPILQPPPVVQPPPVPVLGALGEGPTYAEARLVALSAIGAAGVNFAPLAEDVVLLPHRAIVQDDPEKNALAELRLSTPAHPLWGAQLRCLLAETWTASRGTFVAATVGWVQAMTLDLGPNPVALGGFMARATYSAATEESARDGAEEAMAYRLGIALHTRGLPPAEKVHRVTSTGWLDADSDEGAGVYVCVLAALRLDA